MIKKWIFVFLAVLLVFACVSCASDSGVTLSPEDTFRYALTCLFSGAKDELFALCPAEEMAEGFSHAYQSGMIDKNQYPDPYAAENSSAESYEEHFRTQVLLITSSIASYFDSDRANELAMSYLDSDFDQMFADFDVLYPQYVQMIGEIQILRIDTPAAALEENALTSFSQVIAPRYGAQDATERIALLEINGKTYLSGCMLLRYDDRWMISGLTSAYANLPSIGTPQEYTEEDYLALCSPDEESNI